MGMTFCKYSPSEMLQLPPELWEWLHSPYEPGMNVKILVYTYASGVLSSRRIVRKLEEDVAFRVFAAGNPRSTGRFVSFAGDTWRILSGCSWTLSGLPARWGLRISGSCPSTARRCGRT